jgi:hypothetical protein
MAVSGPGYLERFENYRPSKVLLAWCCILSIIATVVVGFVAGGWVTAGTAAAMADKAGDQASAKLAAEVCIAQFNRNPDAQAQLAALTKLDSWDRGGFVTKGGWATLPGSKDPVSGAADLCAQRLTSTTLSSAQQ